MLNKNIIKINPADNVAVVVTKIISGQQISINSKITAITDIPAGHKIALNNIPKDCKIIKYGNPIGFAAADIKAGEHVHTHNLKTGLDEQLSYSYNPKPSLLTPRPSSNFMGFKRSNGKTGIRNEIWIIPTVGCVNSVGTAIAQKAQALKRGSIEGIYFYPHPYGCSQLGDDHENTKKALCGLINHPNAGGVLVLGLGCENNNIYGIKEMLGNFDENRVKFLVCQEHEDEIAAAFNLLDELITSAEHDIREPIPASELIIGLKCGGSDGFSGITANPLVGAFTDLLIAEGGTAILTEVPEMFGAETILMNRCINDSVFLKTVSLINDFKTYFTAFGHPVYENPSPGNKDGGITTLEDKSLGCIQKSGSSAVTDVLSYGQPVKENGLNLLQAPGNDLVASTALAVSGAHIILFTTGRGTPFGSPVPTVKISSNTQLYNKKRGWIDFDAGILITGAGMAETSKSLYDYVLRLASGEELTKTEVNGIKDMSIFKNGVTL